MRDSAMCWLYALLHGQDFTCIFSLLVTRGGGGFPSHVRVSYQSSQSCGNCLYHLLLYKMKLGIIHGEVMCVCVYFGKFSAVKYFSLEEW